MQLKSSPAMRRGMVSKPQADESLEYTNQAKPKSVYSSRFLYKPPADMRLHAWIRSWFFTKADYQEYRYWIRLRRVKFWVFGKRAGEGLYDKTRRFVVAIFGGRVRPHVYAARMNDCDTCPALQIVMPLSAEKREKWYCGSCGCPKWLLSRLDVKNRFRKWYCPKRKHAGPYPFDEYAERIRERVDEITERAV